MMNEQQIKAVQALVNALFNAKEAGLHIYCSSECIVDCIAQLRKAGLEIPITKMEKEAA
jgi:hypothetical protein